MVPSLLATRFASTTPNQKIKPPRRHQRSLNIRFVYESCTEEDLHLEFEGYGKGNITDCQIPKIENGIRKDRKSVV